MNDKDLKRATIDTNLAFILADVAHSFALSAESRVRKYRLTFMNGGTGTDWMKLKQSAKSLEKEITRHKINCMGVAKEMYQCREEFVESGCTDSDYLQDIIYLIIDRVGDDPTKMVQLRSMIYNNFKSNLGIYDKED